ncbi:hypothetical protein D3C71_02530 [compost metagenome]
MKTTIFAICYVLCLNLFYAQSISSNKFDTIMNTKKCYERKYQIIVYDFAKGVFENSMVKPCYKVPTILKIININPLFYNIQIQADDKVIDYLNTELTEQTKQKIEKSEFIKLPEEKQYSLNADISALLPSVTISNDNSQKVYDVKKKEYDSLNNQLINNQEKYYKEIDGNALKVISDSIQIISRNIQNQEYELRKIENEDSTDNKLIQGIQLRISNLNKNYFTLLENLKEIIKLNGNFNNYIDKVIHPNMNYSEYQKVIDESEKKKIKQNIEGVFLLESKNIKYAYGVINYYKTNSSNYAQKLNDFVYYLNDSEIQKKMENGEYVLKQLNKEVEKAKAQLKTFDDLVTEINLSKKFNHVEMINRLMQNEELFQYTSVPIQGVEDYVEFNVNIESRKNILTDYYPDNKKSFRYFEYLKGGVRLDFSAGVVLNFGTIDKHFSIQNDTIKLNSKNQFIPDLGIFFHSSFRNGSSWAPGIALGTSLDISKFNINSFYLGGSLLIGKRNKVILTAGPAFRLTQELKENFKENSQVVGIKDVNDITTKNFKIGVFFALTYNLTNKQKGLIKIPEQ